MACETCDHTMQRVNNGQPRVSWCPRCGTLKTEGCIPEYVAPTLVARATRLLFAIDTGQHDENAFTPLMAAVRESVRAL